MHVSSQNGHLGVFSIFEIQAYLGSGVKVKKIDSVFFSLFLHHWPFYVNGLLTHKDKLSVICQHGKMGGIFSTLFFWYFHCTFIASRNLTGNFKWAS